MSFQHMKGGNGMRRNKSKQRLMALLLSAIMVVGMMPISAQAETGAFPIGTSGEITAFETLVPDGAETVSGSAIGVDELDDAEVGVEADSAVPIDFLNQYGRQETIKATKLTSDTTQLPDGWYYTTGEMVINDTISVNGNVKIILTDGSNLTVYGGVNVWEGDYATPKRSLTIYGQNAGTGTLNAYSNRRGSAGIGGDKFQGGGNITIIGGRVNAYGRDGGAGIGGGQFGRGATFTMYGGVVNAVGDRYTAAGIGGGTRASGNSVRIYGGVVNAIGGDRGAGIGGGMDDNGGDVFIGGGTIMASSSFSGAGIGGGENGHGGIVVINGGSIKAVGGYYGGRNIGGGVGAGTMDGTVKNSRNLPVYLNTLTLPDKANTTITAVNTNLDLSYGIKDMKTDENSKAYLYLPESRSKELVSLTADGAAYYAVYERKGTLVQTLYSAPQTWDDVQPFLDLNNEGILDLSGFSTPENDKVYTFEVGSNKTLTIRGNGTQIHNIAFTFEFSNTITIENLNIRSADGHGNSFDWGKEIISTAPLYFGENDNTLVVKGTNTITSGQIHEIYGWGSAIGIRSLRKLTITAAPGDTTAILNAYSNSPRVPAIGDGYGQYHGIVTIVNVTVNRSWEWPSAGLGDSGVNDNAFDTSDRPPYDTISQHEPNQPVTASAPITATAGMNGTASTAIPDIAITDAITKAQEEAKEQGKTANGVSVSLDVKMPESASSLSLILSRAALNSLVNAGVMQLENNSAIVSLDFDLEALKEIWKQSTGSVTINVKPVESLSAAAKKLIGARPVYDVTVSSVKDGKTVTITSLGEGSAILSIPYTPGMNEAIGWLYGVYAEENGKATRVPGSAYDANSGNLILSSGHLSVYGVGYTVPTEKYTDITSHWAKESIDYTVGRGLFSGTTDTKFSPDMAMDRGMLVTVLGRLAGVDVSVYKTSSFCDVAEGRYYQPSVEWAYDKGIVNGIGNGKFAPERAVTREEIALILQNYAKATGYTLPITRDAAVFADHSGIGGPYRDAVKAVQQAGIMVGGSGNKFNPMVSATRAEVAAILHRYIKLTIDPATAQGWEKNDDGRYMYYKDGKPLTGWQTIGSDDNKRTYNFTEEGDMVSGKWLEIDGEWYYFYADGSLARSARINGYEVDENGVRKTR
jgi:hypothetical protein